VWVENIDQADGVLQYFKGWFEDSRYKKVWHNYGFDRHVLFNEGIDCQGFAGDTMHMARLWDTSRDKASGGGKGYSLESLSKDLLTSNSKVKAVTDEENSFMQPTPPRVYNIKTRPLEIENESLKNDSVKTSMKDLFGVAKKKKDGEDSKIKQIPDIYVLQRSPGFN
jgi:DNA polymerase-1